MHGTLRGPILSCILHAALRCRLSVLMLHRCYYVLMACSTMNTTPHCIACCMCMHRSLMFLPLLLHLLHCATLSARPVQQMHPFVALESCSSSSVTRELCNCRFSSVEVRVFSNCDCRSAMVLRAFATSFSNFHALSSCVARCCSRSLTLKMNSAFSAFAFASSAERALCSSSCISANECLQIVSARVRGFWSSLAATPAPFGHHTP